MSGSGPVDLERRAWRSVFQDGLMDMALGVIFFGVGLSMTLDLAPAWAYVQLAAAMALSFVLLRVGKQRITVPRLGWVQFGPRAERRRLGAFFVPTIGVAVVVALVPLTGLMHPRPGWTPLVPALVIGVAAWAVLSLTAAAWGFSRLYVHAFILGASFFALRLLDRGWPMLAGSALILLIGIAHLARFLRLHPKPAPEAEPPVPGAGRKTEPPVAVDVQRRASRALNEDGIVDLALGLGLLFVAFYIGLGRRVGTNMAAWTGIFPALVMFLSSGLRKRFVYPRIGYARPRPAGPAILLVAILTLVLAAGLVVMTIYSRGGVRPPAALIPWMLRVLALAGAGALVQMGSRTGLARFYVHAAVFVAAALASVAVRDTDHALILILGLPGLVLFITGTACFVRFLRRHPITETADANA
jgi:hypothetical protein